MRLITALSTLTLLGIGATAGCSYDNPAQTQKQLSDFKGGPMPPDYAKKQADVLKESEAKRNAYFSTHPNAHGPANTNP